MLIICLALVLLSSILLFVYFKSRVGKVEEKLDIMFQLVQSHASQQQNSMKILGVRERYDTPDVLCCPFENNYEEILADWLAVCKYRDSEQYNHRDS